MENKRDLKDKESNNNNNNTNKNKNNAAKSISAILVNPRQRGNPLLQFMKNVPWEYEEGIEADYILGITTCALFLSLKYHQLHPEYVYNRIGKLKNKFKLKLLVIVVDIDNHSEPIKNLTKTSFINDFTIILAWSFQEAGEYLSLYKQLEFAQPNAIQAPKETDYIKQATKVLTTVRGVNKTNVITLLSRYGSIKNAVNDNANQLSSVNGWGDVKISRIQRAFNSPFRPT